MAPEEKPFSISDGANVAKKVELHTMSMEFTAVCFWLRGCRRAGKGWFRAYRTLTISDAISGSAPRPSGTGGLQTLCWREMDSNPRSPDVGQDPMPERIADNTGPAAGGV